MPQLVQVQFLRCTAVRGLVSGLWRAWAGSDEGLSSWYTWDQRKAADLPLRGYPFWRPDCPGPPMAVSGVGNLISCIDCGSTISLAKSQCAKKAAPSRHNHPSD